MDIKVASRTGVCVRESWPVSGGVTKLNGNLNSRIYFSFLSSLSLFRLIVLDLKRDSLSPLVFGLTDENDLMNELEGTKEERKETLEKTRKRQPRRR